MKTKILALAAALVALPALGFAQSSHNDHQTTPMVGSASTKGFQDAKAKMHKGMDIKFTGDADIDFVRGMIPHHQGAVDMAKVVLANGKDPEVKKLATEIIKAQETEIAWMNEWLKKNAK
jgi:uncharacterized protein (DUF305 family)